MQFCQICGEWPATIQVMEERRIAQLCSECDEMVWARVEQMEETLTAVLDEMLP